MGTPTGKRPFWMHQVVEYILGVVVVASGTQSPTPAVPAVLGGVLLVYAASTKSSVAAFRVLPRRIHLVGDPLMVALLVAGAVQPWIEVDIGSQLALVGVAIVHLFVWWQSDYSEYVSRRQRRAAAPEPQGDRSTEVGRAVGRVVGQGITAARRAKRSR